MNIFELFATLTLDDSEYQEKIEGAKEKAESTGSMIGKAFSTAGKATMGFLAGAAAITTATVGTVSKLSGEVAEYGDNIDKMSQKMGISAQAYQEWDAILQHSGSSIESLLPSMKTLASAVDNGSGAFERIGLSLDEVSQMSQEDLFSAVIAGLQGVESQTERTALAAQLLGRGATELGPLLNTSAEDIDAMRQRVHELGGVMSDEAVKSAAAYQDSLQDMQTGLSGFKRNLISDFLPSITKIMDGVTDILTGSDNADTIAEGIGQMIATFGNLISNKLPVIFSLITALITNGLPVIIDSGMNLVFAVIDGIIAAIPELIPAITQIILTLTEKLTEPTTLMKLIDAAFQILGAVAQGLIKAIPKLVKAVPTIISNLLSAILRFLPQVLASGVQLIGELALGIADGGIKVLQALGELLAEIPKRIKKKIDEARQWGHDLIQNFINGILEKWNDLKSTLSDAAQTVKDFLGFSEPKTGPLSNFHTYAPDMMELYAKGIRDNTYLVNDELDRSLTMPKIVPSTSASAGRQTTLPAYRNQTVIFEINGVTFARATYKANNEETQRVGLKLAGGIA